MAGRRLIRVVERPRRGDREQVGGEVGDLPPRQVLAAARGAGPDGPLELGVAAAPGAAWTAAQIDNTWPDRLDKVAVDPGNATVTARADFADRPVLAELSTSGIQAHLGVCCSAWSTRLRSALLAAGVLTPAVLGYRMWSQRRHPRRPTRRARLGAARGSTSRCGSSSRRRRC